VPAIAYPWTFAHISSVPVSTDNSASDTSGASLLCPEEVEDVEPATHQVDEWLTW
jgi:hypothetical protein